MKAMTYTAARQNLAKTMEKVCADHAPVIVTRKSSNSVVIMSLEDYEALEETAYLLRSPKNTRRLIESIAQLENDKRKVTMMSSLSFDTQRLIEICRKNDVLKIGVFGSYARGEATEYSDIDLLVKFAKPKSLLGLFALERQMSESLGNGGFSMASKRTWASRYVRFSTCSLSRMPLAFSSADFTMN